MPAAAALVALLLGVVHDGARAARAAERIKWLTGSKLRQQLQQPVGITWSGAPLRPALASLAEKQRLAILLDRRIDPDQKLELALASVPLESALAEIASSRDLGFCLLGPVAYFGPRDAARRLRTLAALRTQELKLLGPDARRVLARELAWRWDDLATPRDLIEQLAAEAGSEVAGLEQVPHDLWAGADLPPLSLVHRLTLVAVQFDLTFQVDQSGRRLTLVPVPDEVSLRRTYPGGRHPEELAARWAGLAPESRVQVVGGKIVVEGRLEDHERLAGAKPGAEGPPAGGVQVYSLRYQDKPLRALLDELKRRLKLEIRIDERGLEEAGISLDQNVSFSVTQVALDDLLKAALTPAGLEFRRRDDAVEVYPAARK